MVLFIPICFMTSKSLLSFTTRSCYFLSISNQAFSFGVSSFAPYMASSFSLLLQNELQQTPHICPLTFNSLIFYWHGPTTMSIVLHKHFWSYFAGNSILQQLYFQRSDLLQWSYFEWLYLKRIFFCNGHIYNGYFATVIFQTAIIPTAIFFSSLYICMSTLLVPTPSHSSLPYWNEFFVSLGLLLLVVRWRWRTHPFSITHSTHTIQS